ncbi:MAG TPA: signal peptide peptidase SppA [Myxococcota bacterium]|nr:signal peptide peptidase SppA [Myxococcota bacterium]
MSMWIALLCSMALGQQERLDAPAASISAEDGAAAGWVNPANLAFDSDPSMGVWYRQDFQTYDSEFAVSTTGGGTSLGLVFKNDLDGKPWWGFSSGLGVRLPENFRLGATVTWNLPEGANNNFVSWDLGAGYRPFPWLGFGGVARNIGNPSPALGVWARYGLSTTIRPLRDKLELSVDYEYLDTSAASVVGDANLNQLAAIVRIRPTSGLVLRGEGRTNPEFSTWSVGGGLEVYFEGLGGGAYAVPLDGDVMAYITTGPEDEHLFGAGRRVPVVNLDGNFPYQPQTGFLVVPEESYVHLLERLRHASEDRHVKGLVLELSSPRLSWAQTEEIRAAVETLQAEGKPVVAYLNGTPSNGAYYLASVCDKIYLHPAGSLDLVGLSLESQYFRGALDLVGVKPQYAKRAEYKSSPEQFTNTEPSEPAKEQMNALLDGFYGALLLGISDGRGIPVDEVEALIDEGPFTGAEALEKGLVDGLVYPDTLEEQLAEHLVRGFELKPDYRVQPETSGWKAHRQIAIVYVDGPIVSGPSQGPGLLSGGNTGADTVIAYLRAAEEDGAVKAVVLRVDSPGGSAFASDEIWRAVEQLQEAGKPVVVSMGGVAASGGYYVAAGSDAIFAEPTTITGSIGVYGGKFSFAELFDKVGIDYEIYTRGRKAAMYSTSREMDEIELAAMDRLIEDTYVQFKTVVSEGRGLSMEEVEEVARGRVWTGAAAKEVGLVDELGGLQDAIVHAKVVAGLDEDDEIELITYRGAPDSFGEVPAEAVRAVRTALQPELELPEDVAAWIPYAPLSEERVLLLMPERIEVE